MEEIIIANGRKYTLIRPMGKGKGGYSYLAKRCYTGAEDNAFYPEICYENDDLYYKDLTTRLIIGAFASVYMFEGYSTVPKRFVLVKKIHHEPCDYYTFGNKIEAEKFDYQKLVAAGIRVPKLYSVDEENEIIVKQFIDGPTVMDMLNRSDEPLPEGVFEQAREMAAKAYAAGLNIDYYPTNFVLDKDGVLYYVDYECNPYAEEWSFENWGIKHWKKEV